MPAESASPKGADLPITIIGAGAMACLFGARLAAVSTVTLADEWKEGIEAVAAHGIRLEENGQITTVRVRARRPEQVVEAAPLVIVLVKSWQTERVAAWLPRLLAPEGIALTLQNGLGNLEKLGPAGRLGVTTLGATLLGPGQVRAAGGGATHLAAPAWIVDSLRRAGFDVRPVETSGVRRLMWGKLAVNCGINPLTALLRVTNGELLARPDARFLMECAAQECAQVAAAQDIQLLYADAAAEVRRVAELTATNRSSMLQDVLRGAPTEIDAINGAVARLAQELGIATPVNHTLWRLVRALTDDRRG